MGTKLKKASDFKFDLIFAFFIFAFILIIITTYTSIYLFTRITTEEFQEKIKLISQNIYSDYKTKENTIKITTLALAKNNIFNTQFTPSDEVIKAIFKTMLYANSDLKEINLFNQYGKNIISCKKYNNSILCFNTSSGLKIKDFQKNQDLLFEEKFNKNSVEFKALAPAKIANKIVFIEVKANIKDIFKNNDIFNVLFIDNKGNILFSNIYKNQKNINDIFNYFLDKKILEIKNGFVTDDIYVKSLSPNMKIVFIQNKKLIDKTNEISKTLTLILIIFSIFVAIPLGVFFSKPLYKFYEDLDKRVKEEIEKRRQKEQILMHQSKLAALGEMLGNIAHQWRHPLTRLSLLIQNFELAHKMNKLTPEYIEKFKQNAIEQIKYMSATIDDFTNFFKRDTKKVEFNAEDVIKDALKLMEGRIKSNKIEINLDKFSSKDVTGYKTEFSQVILNVLNNAVDVLKERDIKNKKIWIRIYNDKIEIEDNAGGIDENIKDKIFEPYFTTKFQSQGTGIGLYMSKVILNQHFNGDIYAYNSKNGAVFVIKV